MDAEDGAGCPHMWLLEELEFGAVINGLVTRYRCELCEAELEVPPDPRPTTC